MAATEVIMGSLQQASPAIGSSTIISIKPSHSSFEFGRSHKRQNIPLQASMASKEDHGATLHKEKEESSSKSSSVSSILRAVQEGGPNAVMQQVSSLRHFFMPELPYAIITEIKKRMPLSFREDGEEEEEEMHHGDNLSGGLIIEEELEEQLSMMGPRCAWPRAKLASVEDERQAGAQAIQGPRCAWPRGSAQAIDSLQQSVKEEEVAIARNEADVANGAKGAWPRKISRAQHQRGLSSMSTHEGHMETSISSMEGSTISSLKDVSKRSLEEPMGNTDIIQGPRCAWPRSTPRRMLATGVGLGLMNYLFIGQGAPALAILLQSPLTITCEENDSLISRHRSLLP